MSSGMIQINRTFNFQISRIHNSNQIMTDINRSNKIITKITKFTKTDLHSFNFLTIKSFKSTKLIKLLGSSNNNLVRQVNHKNIIDLLFFQTKFHHFRNNKSKKRFLNPYQLLLNQNIMPKINLIFYEKTTNLK